MTSSQPFSFATFRKRIDETRAWAADNPELAAAWEEADEIEEQRNNAALKANAERQFIAEATGRLTSMGAPLRASELVQAEAAALESKRRYWESDSMRAAREFVGGKSSFLLLFGGVGGGKTCAAVSVLFQCRTTLYEDWQVIWDTSNGRFIRAAEAARLSRFDDQDLWSDLLRVRWLVIDDLGVESVNDYWRERINELLDTRYGNKLRTVITCNLSPEAFKATYGERIASRIRDDGIVAGCGDRDFRRNPL